MNASSISTAPLTEQTKPARQTPERLHRGMIGSAIPPLQFPTSANCRQLSTLSTAISFVDRVFNAFSITSITTKQQQDPLGP